jgi:hypothetical protein
MDLERKGDSATIAGVIVLAVVKQPHLPGSPDGTYGLSPFPSSQCCFKYSRLQLLMARQIITPGTVRRNPYAVTTKTGFGKTKGVRRESAWEFGRERCDK